MTRWGEYCTRVVDISVGLVGTFVFLFLLPVIGFLIRLDSPGPILYRALRVGRRGRLFTMYKFRSMYVKTELAGGSVTPQGDLRVTQVGSWLRRTKLDEFPQFLNILKGDMTLIGPRPEAPDLAADYPEGAKQVFEAKPGLIGPNQIIGRNEEEWYPPGVNPRKYYLEEILPGKVANDLEYLQKKSFWGDLKLLTAGVWTTVSGVVGRQHFSDNRNLILMVGIDALCCILAISGAFIIGSGGFSWHSGILIPLGKKQVLLSLLPAAVLVRLPVFVYFGFYRILIRYFSLADFKRVLVGLLISSGFLLIFIGFLSGITLQNISPRVFFLDWLILATMVTGYRVIGKIFIRWKKSSCINGVPRRRVLIWGADDEGVWCHRFLKESGDPSYEVVGFLDPDPRLRNRFLDGLNVLGDQTHLEACKSIYKIQEIYVTGIDKDQGELQQLAEDCRRLSLRILQFKPRTVEEIRL